MAQAVVNFDRAGQLGQANTLQSAANCLKLAVHQQQDAPVEILANPHRLPKILPFGSCLEILDSVGHTLDFNQQLVFSRLKLFKLVQILAAQGLELQLQHGGELVGEFRGLMNDVEQVPLNR